MIPRRRRRCCRLLLLLAHGVTGGRERERGRELVESVERGTEARGRESRLQVFRSLMCDLPQTRQSVPPFPSGSAGFKESALGPPPTASLSFSYAFLQNPTGIPYYTAAQPGLTFFPERLSFRLSDVSSRKRRNAPREKNPEVTLSLSHSLSLSFSLAFKRDRERGGRGKRIRKTLARNYFSIGL